MHKIAKKGMFFKKDLKFGQRINKRTDPNRSVQGGFFYQNKEPSMDVYSGLQSTIYKFCFAFCM